MAESSKNVIEPEAARVTAMPAAATTSRPLRISGWPLRRPSARVVHNAANSMDQNTNTPNFSASDQRPIAAAFEGFWELLENSPIIIQRYREATVSWGYTGDSIVNSLSDVGWMIVGFLFASRVPAWVSVSLAIGLELFTLAMIRDNLTLNIVMLVWPIEAIRQWQLGA